MFPRCWGRCKILATIRERRWSLIRLMIERLPQFVSQYQGIDRQYVNEFLHVLQYFNVANLSARKRFLEAATVFLENNYLSNPDYYRLPFLWFAVTFLRHLKVHLERVDRKTPRKAFEQFLGLFSSILRSSDGQTGIYPYLEAGISCTDDKWDVLQSFAFAFKRYLTEEEFGVIRLLYTLLPDLRFTDLSYSTLRLVLGQHTTSKVIQDLSEFVAQQEIEFIFIPNEYRLGIERYEVLLELPRDTPLTDIINLQDPVNTIITTSQFYTEYQGRGSTKMYMGVVHLPERHDRALNSFLRTQQNQGKIITFKLNRILESLMTYSIATYRSDTGYSHVKTFDAWRVLGDMMDGRGSESFSFERMTPDDTFFIQYYGPGPQEPISQILLRTLTTLAGTFPLTNFSLELSSQEKAWLDLWQNTGVFFLTMSVNQLVYQIELSPLVWIHLPPTPLDQLRSLLSFAPLSTVHRTNEGVGIRSRFPSTVASTFLTPGWAAERQATIWEVVSVHRGSRYHEGYFEAGKQKWRTPAILVPYL